MDNIIIFLALFTATATAVQVSLFRKFWQQLIVAMLIAVGTYLFFPIAISYSSADLQELLANADRMLDMSVVLVFEAVVMLILALFMLRDMYSKLTLPWKLIPLLQYLPTLSSVGVLCYFQVLLYQQGLQWAFEKTAMAYGCSIAVAVVVLGFCIKLLIPMRLLRLELKLAMHAAQIVLAIAVSVLTATYPYRDSEIDPNVSAFAVVLVLFALGTLAGFRRYQTKSKLVTAR